VLLIILGTSFFSAVTLFMVTPFLTIHLTSSGLMSLEQAGLIVGIAFWIKRGGGLLGGMAADRFGRRRIMIAALAIRIPGYVLLAYATTFFSLLLGAALVSMGTALYQPAAKSALTMVTSVSNRIRVFALRTAAVNTGAAIGPLIGTLLLGYSSKLLFLAAGGAFVLITLVNAGLRFPDRHRASEGGLRLALAVARAPYMLGLMVFGALFFLVYIQTETIVPVLVKDAGRTDLLGPLFGAWAAVVVVAQIIVSRFILSIPRQVSVLLGFTAFVLGFSVLHFAGRVPQLPFVVGLFAAISLFGIAEVILDLRLDYDASLVPIERVGTSFGFVNVACGIGGLMGSSIGSFAYHRLDSSAWPISSVWLLMAVLSVAAVPILRGVDRRHWIEAVGEQN
jgi:DHA1 family multidrug resistance protein-like MFS transporter